ncbi:MAG TPA: hypothetical protein VML95_04110 [Longimicrobiales bacterium]|nr:hypothetical protein [Longimicrobiales bacterium]
MQRALIAVAAFALLAGGCVSQTVSRQESTPGPDAVAPSLVVERFLQAVNARDVTTLGRLFGTSDGPISARDDRAAVEQRMFTLASLLQHDDYTILGDQVVPGRAGEAIDIMTTLRKGQRAVAVPFTLVRTREGGWLVERIETGELTRR